MSVNGADQAEGDDGHDHDGPRPALEDPCKRQEDASEAEHQPDPRIVEEFVLLLAEARQGT